jgi:hypothetical protein
MSNKTGFFRGLSFFLLTTILFSGCEKLDLGKPVECTIGTSYRVNAGLSFKIDSLQDYRCPSDLDCFWGGDVDLYFDFDHHSKQKVGLLNLYSTDHNPFSIGGYTFKVLSVSPHYRSDEERKKEDYRVQIVVTKN